MVNQYTDKKNEWLKDNKEKLKAQKHAYYLAHKEKWAYPTEEEPEKLAKVRAQKRAYYHRHKERRRRIMCEQGRKYSRRNHEKNANRPCPELCEICEKPNSKKGIQNIRLCFDHDHKTGQFRGWICSNCNHALGKVKDDPEILRRMIIYLSAA